jgi:hypothetical protein
LVRVRVCCPEDRRLKAGSPIPVAGLEFFLPDSLACDLAIVLPFSLL